MEIYYTGIGSRETPNDIRTKMSQAAKVMAGLGFILRSGGAGGADTAFYEGVKQAQVADRFAEIYVPKVPFNGFSPEYGNFGTVLGPPTKNARLLAKKYHPNWPVLGDLGRDFMARNAYQVLGSDLNTPSSFILCWTPNGKVVGGTGQALRMADDLDIPVLNFAIHSDEHISDFILSQSNGANS